MFEGQPKGLYTLALANTGERFGYYTMLAVFSLFLQENFNLEAAAASTIYSSFLMFVYFLPLFGGMLADKFGYKKMVTIGVFIMFLGYALLSIPAGNGLAGYTFMYAALAFVCMGTGLFKGNLQVMVGNLFDNPKYADKRDSAFSIFYMAINIGALFAPTAAIKIMDYAQNTLQYSRADSYHFAFAVACVSLIVSIAIYYLGRNTYIGADGSKAEKAGQADVATEELSSADTRARVVALCLVFAVVIFFWMAFHQNGLTLTFFARDYTATSSTGVESMMFDVWNLCLVVVLVYALFALFQSATSKGRGIAAVVVLASVGLLVYKYTCVSGTTTVDAPIFQQFNPFFVVALTPVSMAIFGSLAKKGKEPSAPVKIALGMLVAAAAYVLMAVASFGLPAPEFAESINAETGEIVKTPLHMANVTPNLLVSTYLILTFAELLLSPMGISFVSKVAPPKYKGLMMGGWFVATAVGNFLVAIPGWLWGIELWVLWLVLAGLCLLSYVFITSQMKKLKKVA